MTSNINDNIFSLSNEEVDREVAEKRRAFEEWLQRRAFEEWLQRRAFEEWLQRRDRVTYDRYRAQGVVVKLAVQAAKRMVDRRSGERLGNDFDGNKKMFWKEVKLVRKGEQTREEMVKDVNGQILRDGVEVKIFFIQIKNI